MRQQVDDRTIFHLGDPREVNLLQVATQLTDAAQRFSPNCERLLQFQAPSVRPKTTLKQLERSQIRILR